MDDNITIPENMSPRKAIKQHCRECIEGGNARKCEITDCPSFPLRAGGRQFDENGKSISPLKTIRKHCLDCCLGSVEEVRNCFDNECALWPYRFGKNPKMAGRGNIANFTKNRAFGRGENEIVSEGIITPTEEERTINAQ